VQRHRCRPAQRCDEAVLPRLELHLSAARAAAAAEEYLLTGPLEATNEWYAVAKLAGIKMCQAYARQYGMRAISLLPTNLYGPGDNFSLRTRTCCRRSSAVATKRAAWGRRVDGLGTGTPRRSSCTWTILRCLRVPDGTLRVGRADHVGQGGSDNRGARHQGRDGRRFQGRLAFDRRSPTAPRKLLDTSKSMP